VIRAAVALAWLAVFACGGGSRSATPTTPPPASGPAVESTASLEITSEEVAFTANGNSVPGTLVRPTAPGKRRALVLMAGSGPTDRDWNSPLMPGKNGSGKLLAEALARRGVIVLRFDKASVAANKTPLANQTFDVYRDEGRAALAYMRTRPEVATDKLYIAGHSEGGMHATRVALAEGNAITNPATASLSRSMLGWDPLAAVAQLRVPILVYNGRRDVQVDPELDAHALAKSNDRERTELHIASEADHVLKHETRTIAELKANLMIVQSQMNAESRVLDPASIDIIATWLARH